MFKVGHAHGGMGKVRVDNEKGFQVSQNYENVILQQINIMDIMKEIFVYITESLFYLIQYLTKVLLFMLCFIK